MQKNTIEELILFSKENPDQVITVDDGRIITNGTIFKNKEEFGRFLKIGHNLLRFRNQVAKWFPFLFR